MRVKIVLKMLLLVIFGAAFGLITQNSHEKWHTLGKQAYLANQSLWFDKKMADPTSTMAQVTLWIFLALLVGFAYEGAAHLGQLLLNPKPQLQGKE